MKNKYLEIREAKAQKQKLLAILIDPDKIILDNMDQVIAKIVKSPATHIFVG